MGAGVAHRFHQRHRCAVQPRLGCLQYRLYCDNTHGWFGTHARRRLDVTPHELHASHTVYTL